jgi:hypothetical protein
MSDRGRITRRAWIASARPCRSAPRLFEARRLRSIRRAVQALGRYVRAKASGMVLPTTFLRRGRELTTQAPQDRRKGLNSAEVARAGRLLQADEEAEGKTRHCEKGKRYDHACNGRAGMVNGA